MLPKGYLQVLGFTAAETKVRMQGLPGMKRQWIGCFTNGNLAVRLKALQLYIYWDALKGLNYIA